MNNTDSDHNLLFFATSRGHTAFDYANSLVDADPTQAIRYYEISGNMGNSKAFYLAGKVSVKLKNYEKAAILFEKGYKQEHSLSAFELVKLYLYNKVQVPRAKQKAIKLLRYAAENLIPAAQIMLASILLELNRSYFSRSNLDIYDSYEFWLGCAALNHHPAAFELIQRTKKRMQETGRESANILDLKLHKIRSIILSDYSRFLTVTPF